MMYMTSARHAENTFTKLRFQSLKYFWHPPGRILINSFRRQFPISLQLVFCPSGFLLRMACPQRPTALATPCPSSQPPHPTHGHCFFLRLLIREFKNMKSPTTRLYCLLLVFTKMIVREHIWGKIRKVKYGVGRSVHCTNASF